MVACFLVKSLLIIRLLFIAISYYLCLKNRPTKTKLFAVKLRVGYHITRKVWVVFNAIFTYTFLFFLFHNNYSLLLLLNDTYFFSMINDKL